MIDDLMLAEAYENELVLEDYWADINMGFDERAGYINYLPKSQIGMESESPEGGNIGDYEFTGAMLNNGMADQYDLKLQMTILKNGEQVFQEESDASELWSLDRDTLIANTPFLADDYGDYKIKFDAISENAEERPFNNTKELMFSVTDSLYHRADFTDESGVNTGGWVEGGSAGDMIGVWYDIIEPVEIKSITGKIRRVDDEEFPEFQYVLLKNIPDEGITEWLLTEIVPADSTMEGTWVTLDIEKDGETEFLEPGEYITAIRFWGDDGTEEGSNGVSVGWDKDNLQASYTYFYGFRNDVWFNPDKMALIGMVLNEHDGPSSAAVTFNVDMNTHIANGDFSPGADFVDVAGSFNDWAGSDAFTDEDGDGIYTMMYAEMLVGEKLQYKYRINGNDATAELVDDDPRTYTVRYWNVLDDIFNRGVTTGVDNIVALEKFEVYPNPNSGQFTVSITSSNSTDVNIKLYNLQGKAVYTKELKGVYNHKEKIDQVLVKGLYFLTLETNAGVKTQKVIVK